MIDKNKSFWTFKDISPTDYELIFHLRGHKKLKGKFFQELFNAGVKYVSKGKRQVSDSKLDFVQEYEIDGNYYRLMEVNLRGEINRVVSEVEIKFPIRIRNYRINKAKVKKLEDVNEWEIIIFIGGVYGRKI